MWVNWKGSVLKDVSDVARRNVVSSVLQIIYVVLGYSDVDSSVRRAPLRGESQCCRVVIYNKNNKDVNCS